MILRILSILLWIFVLSSCTKKPEEPEETYDNFDFYIESISNITSSSATIKATLTMYKTGTINISGLFVQIETTTKTATDSLCRESDFKKKEGIVELTITDLKPNTVYSILPMARFNPPYINQYATRIIAIGSANSTESFTTLAK